MNTVHPGQLTPTQSDVLSLITTDEEDTFWPFEITDPPEEEQVEFPEPDDLLDIDDLFQADVTCMKLIFLQDRMDEIESLYRQELDHLNRWKERRSNILLRQYEYLSRSLESWLAATNQKTANLPHGTLQFRKQRPRVEINDEKPILSAGVFVRTKQYPDKTAILRHYKETGEIIEGVAIVEPEPKFSIKLIRKEYANVQSKNPTLAG